MWSKIIYMGEKIAFEKAGIIKENSNVVVYPQEENIINTIKDVAKNKNANVYETDKKINKNKL